ncbi:MAG: hypothetical protein QXH07_07085 [Thermoplasmata archaeon]
MANVVQPVQVGQIGTGDKWFLVQFSVPASAAANTVLTGTIYPYGLSDGTTFTAFQVPSGIRYSMVDLGVSAAPQTDGQVEFYLNGNKQGENFFLSTIVYGNTSKSKPSQPIILVEGATFTVKLTLLTAAPSTAYTQNLLLHFIATPA